MSRFKEKTMLLILTYLACMSIIGNCIAPTESTAPAYALFKTITSAAEFTRLVVAPDNSLAILYEPEEGHTLPLSSTW